MFERLQPTERTMALTNEIPPNEADAGAGGTPPAAEGKAKPGRKSKAAAKGAAEVAASSRKHAAVAKTIKSKWPDPMRWSGFSLNA
jgi:hypothetical protein